MFHSFLGYVAAGVFKLFTGICWIFNSFVLCCFGLKKFKESAKKRCFGVACGMSFLGLIVLCTIVNSLWYLIDWIRVLAGDFKDGNGVPLKNW